MKKFKNFAAPILKFLRELSVVATGIIITVGLGFWVNNVNNKNDLKLYLDALVTEMEENATKFDFYEKWMQKSVRYGEYIRSNDKNSLNQDSLIFYSYSRGNIYYDGDDNAMGCGYLNTGSYVGIFSTTAFEILKNSNIMHQIKDKELLFSIWYAYRIVESSMHNFEDIFQIKKELQMRDDMLLAEGKPVVVPMELYYKYEYDFSIVSQCQTTSKILKETVSKLKESKWVSR